MRGIPPGKMGIPSAAAIGMRIARDGTWYHEGSPIRRPAMVRLFSTVLRREPDGRHLLVTPVEKLEIDVDGTAFRAVEMHSEGEGRQRRLAFRLDSGDAVILGPDHPLRVVADERGPRPRILVRHGRGRVARRSMRMAESRWLRAINRPASGATAPSLPSRPNDSRRSASLGAVGRAGRTAAPRR